MPNILLAIIAFGVMIFFHELGHFLVAKRVGITVYAFALGFGPRIAGFTRSGTQYAINAIPFGGYVRLAGEDLDATTGPGSFRAKTVWQRMAVVTAGPMMNVVLAVVLLTTTALAVGVPVGASNRIGRLVNSRAGVLDRIRHYTPAPTPAEAAGLRPGDAIVAIDGKPMVTGDTVVDTIHRSPNKPLVLRIEREGTRFDVTVTPRLDPRQRIGLIGFAPQLIRERMGLVRAFSFGLSTTGQYVEGIVTAITTLLRQRQFDQLAGPVGALKILGEAAQVGIDLYIHTAALLSVMIGIFNLLPVPALDGGRLLFLIVEVFRRQPVDPRREGYIHLVGFALLLVLLVTLTWRDIGRF